MKLRERYDKLKAAAIQDVRAVRNRVTHHYGTYPKNCSNIAGEELLEGVKTAATLGYETHLRVVDDAIAVYYVAKMPTVPTAVVYA